MEDKIQDKMEQDQHEIDEHMEEHNYDGIQELDNPPPRWIMAIFYITIAFSIFYAANFFWFKTGDNQDTAYLKKSQAHDLEYNIGEDPDAVLAAMTSDADLAAGKEVYASMNCFTCHGMNGEGNAIGPNLTDDYTLHGCDFESVYEIIKNGNPTKGMTAFKGQISDTKIKQVSSYVMSLVGSNPANAKEAQGDLCE